MTPEDEPRGILFLMDPAWADFIEEDWKFEQAVNQAWREGRLYAEQTPSLH
jgi:hypothetical protein